jgi:hypothetical protein
MQQNRGSSKYSKHCTMPDKRREQLLATGAYYVSNKADLAHISENLHSWKSYVAGNKKPVSGISLALLPAESSPTQPSPKPNGGCKCDESRIPTHPTLPIRGRCRNAVLCGPLFVFRRGSPWIGHMGPNILLSFETSPHVESSFTPISIRLRVNDSHSCWSI